MAFLKKIISPYGLLLLSLLVLLAGRYIFKQKYLDCCDIVIKHINCFKNSSGKISYISIFLYFMVPLLLAVSLVQIRNIDESVINILTIIVSILTSMFFTLLTLILDMRKRVVTDQNYNAGDAALSKKLLKETYYALMFEVLVSVIILLLCFVELFAKQYYCILGMILYYLTFVLVTNLFMILKRIFKVINKDLENG